MKKIKKIVDELYNRWKSAYNDVREDWLSRNNHQPICSQCGKKFPEDDVKHWQLHNTIHRQVIDKENPSKDTICLCVSCHRSVETEKYERPDGTIIEY